jgi:hypothetical protein
MAFFRIKRKNTPTTEIIVHDSAVKSIEIIKALSPVDTYDLVLRAASTTGSWLVAERAKANLKDLTDLRDLIWAELVKGTNAIDIEGDDLPEPVVPTS